MKKITTPYDKDTDKNVDIIETNEAAYFSDAIEEAGGNEKSVESLQDNHDDGNVTSGSEGKAEKINLNFKEYMKLIHVSPLLTLKRCEFSKLKYGMLHIFFGAIVIGAAVVINSIFSADAVVSGGEAEALSVLSIFAGVITVSIAALLPYGVSLFNNFFIGTIIYIFAKTLNIKYEKGDYRGMLSNLFPSTALVATPLTLLMMLNVNWSEFQSYFYIACGAISITPSLMAYSSLASVGKKGKFVYAILIFWTAVSYWAVNKLIH